MIFTYSMQKIVFYESMRFNTRIDILAQLETEGISGICNADMDVVISDEDAEKILSTWSNMDFEIQKA